MKWATYSEEQRIFTDPLYRFDDPTGDVQSSGFRFVFHLLNNCVHRCFKREREREEREGEGEERVTSK